MSTEYRLVVHLPHGRKRATPKKTLTKALEDMEQLKAERERGELAPYWNDAEIYIEQREVSKWSRIQLSPV